MKYDFNVKIKNIPCHLDIARDIKEQKDGVFTFTVRINQQLIQDYVNYSNPAASEYTAILSAVGTKCEISRNGGDVNSENPIR